MKCPNCAQDIHTVKANSTLGNVIVLDQCPACGGIWFDRWELYQTSDGAVDTLDPVNTGSLRLSTPISDKPLQCPKCSIALSRFIDPLLPQDAHILRCPSCQGLWLNRGELRKFKEFRRKKLSSAPKPLPPEVVAILQKNMGKKEFWQNLGEKASVLSQTPGLYQQGALAEKLESGDIVFSALNILLSLL